MIGPTLFLLTSALVVAVAMVVRDPDIASRVVAFDVAVISLLGILAVDASSRGTTVFLDALPVLGLLAVLATLAAGWMLARGDDGDLHEEVRR